MLPRTNIDVERALRHQRFLRPRPSRSSTTRGSTFPQLWTLPRTWIGKNPGWTRLADLFPPLRHLLRSARERTQCRRFCSTPIAEADITRRRSPATDGAGTTHKPNGENVICHANFSVSFLSDILLCYTVNEYYVCSTDDFFYYSLVVTRDRLIIVFSGL